MAASGADYNHRSWQVVLVAAQTAAL